jgi:hypothetical protein
MWSQSAYNIAGPDKEQQTMLFSGGFNAVSLLLLQNQPTVRVLYEYCTSTCARAPTTPVICIETETDRLVCRFLHRSWSRCGPGTYHRRRAVSPTLHGWPTEMGVRRLARPRSTRGGQLGG